ncbi:MAG: type II secretion system protein [Firmicutes bacterium]|nr:type II secretion system protein [Bacillota bacterium]
MKNIYAKEDKAKMLGSIIKKLRSNEGYTLNEMVVTICIMVILIAMLVPRAVGYIQQANYVHDVYAAKTIYDAVELAMLDPDTYYKAKTALGRSNYNFVRGGGGAQATYIAIPSKYYNFMRTRLKETGVTEVYNPYRNGSSLDRNGRPISQANFRELDDVANEINECIGENKYLGTRMGIRFWDGNARSPAWQVTDQFVIVADKNEPRDIAIYLGSSKGKNENGIIMKIYPPDDDSRKLDFSYVRNAPAGR